jgi:predicted Co/Zn/Cd cation transporter (cation efflux family)
MRVLFQKTHSGVNRALRYALLVLALLFGCVYGVREAMMAVLDGRPSLLVMIGVALPLGLLVVVAMRWHHLRRMRRAVVELQDSALW